jgi:hypothetical protein
MPRRIGHSVSLHSSSQRKELFHRQPQLERIARNGRSRARKVRSAGHCRHQRALLVRRARDFSIPPRTRAMQHVYRYHSCSSTRLNSMGDRRSNEHTRFTLLDDAYRIAFINWAGYVQCLKAPQQFRVSRRQENAEETRTSKELIYRESRSGLAEFMLDRLKTTARRFPRRSLDGQN